MYLLVLCMCFVCINLAYMEVSKMGNPDVLENKTQLQSFGNLFLENPLACDMSSSKMSISLRES